MHAPHLSGKQQRDSRPPVLLLGSLRPSRGLVLAVWLALLAHPAARAQTSYKIQPILTVGDTVAGVRVTYATPTSLNDRGQLTIQVGNAAGGDALLLRADDQFTPIVVRGQDFPGGKWPNNVDVVHRELINQRGSFLFVATATLGGTTGWGTFRWDGERKQVASLALVGTPAVNGLVFVSGGNRAPGNGQINNREEIVFSPYLPDSAGTARRAVLLLGQDQKLLPVVLLDQPLPGGGTVADVGGVSLTDEGAVAFRAHRPEEPTGTTSAYLWEKGTISPVALAGAEAPGGGVITHVNSIFANDKNRTLLVALRVRSSATATLSVSLYRFAAGQLTALVVPGQPMPDGGQFVSVLEQTGTLGITSVNYISHANAAGEHVFLARLTDGTRGVYKLDAEGKLSLVLKSGATTELGRVSNFPDLRHFALDAAGRVAMTVNIAGRPETLVLLTPTTP